MILWIPEGYSQGINIWAGIDGQEAKSRLEGLKTKPETKIQEEKMQSLRQDVKI